MDIVNLLIPDIEWDCMQQETARECAEAIANRDADWMTAEGRDAHIAYTTYGLTAILAQEGGLGDGFDAYSVAVVKKEFCDDNEEAVLLDLAGKKTCHPSYGDPAGWEIPVGLLSDLGIMEPVKDEPLIENDAESAVSFFGDMCVPNSNDSGPQRKRRGGSEEWPPLCKACEGSCTEESPYYGDRGAHQCLSDDVGEVAFVKHSAIFEFDDDIEREDLRLICPSTPSCVEVDAFEDCNLGMVPARSVIVRDDPGYATLLRGALMNLTGISEFGDIVLDEEANPENHIFSNAGSEFVELEDGVEELLGTSLSVYDAIEELAAPGGTEVIVCIPYSAGDSERAECSRIFGAANVSGITFDCVVGETAETCMRMLYDGDAHLTSLDGGDVFRAHHAYGLVPLVREISEIGERGVYYGVAVVNADFCEDDDVTLADLEGMRSCHTGYRKMAGWRIPVGVLLSTVEAFNATGRRDRVEDDAELVADFFETTCAPRVSGNGPQNTNDGTGELWPKLCTGCKGNCLTNDQYYDYPGAFRCLMEGEGDVAFVKHTTVLEYAEDGELDEVLRAWATKPSSEFKLLCRDGGCAEVGEYEDCHLALAPSHALVGSPILGERGSLADVGRVIKQGIVAAVGTSRFFDEARGFIADFPFSSSTESLEEVDGGWQGYITDETDEALNAFADLVDGEKRFNPGDFATFCAFTEAQLEACETNIEIYAEIEPGYSWECLLEDSIEECYESLQRGTSQFMVASPKEALEGHQSYDLKAIAAEAVGAEKETFVYSVAVVESETCSDKIYFTDFEGEAACFAAYGSDSGWETPVSVMMNQGFLSTVDETEEQNKAIESAITFFGKLCAPHDQDSEQATDTLCEACAGDCGLEDEFHGPTGAIECMKQNKGSVAVTDSTVLEDKDLTDGLQLLCPYRRDCQEIDSFERCNFGRTPTDVILTNGDADSAYISRVSLVLIEASVKKNYMSILGNTRETGELVAVTGSTDLHLNDYLTTQQVLEVFESFD